MRTATEVLAREEERLFESIEIAERDVVSCECQLREARTRVEELKHLLESVQMGKMALRATNGLWDDAEAKVG